MERESGQQSQQVGGREELFQDDICDLTMNHLHPTEGPHTFEGVEDSDSEGCDMFGDWSGKEGYTCQHGSKR